MRGRTDEGFFVKFRLIVIRPSHAVDDNDTVKKKTELQNSDGSKLCRIINADGTVTRHRGRATTWCSGLARPKSKAVLRSALHDASRGSPP